MTEEQKQAEIEKNKDKDIFEGFEVFQNGVLVENEFLCMYSKNNAACCFVNYEDCISLAPNIANSARKTKTCLNWLIFKSEWSQRSNHHIYVSK